MFKENDVKIIDSDRTNITDLGNHSADPPNLNNNTNEDEDSIMNDINISNSTSNNNINISNSNSSNSNNNINNDNSNINNDNDDNTNNISNFNNNDNNLNNEHNNKDVEDEIMSSNSNSNTITLSSSVNDGNNINDNSNSNSSNNGNTIRGNAIKRRYNVREDLYQFSSLGDDSPTDECNSLGVSLMDTDFSDKLMQPPEEPIYFLEKYPGKLCSLCNLPERSQLGQGEMLKIEIAENDKKVFGSQDNNDLNLLLGGDKSPRSLNAPQSNNRRQKGLNKCKNPNMAAEYINELDKVGFTEILDFTAVQDAGYIYIHRSCAIWSSGIIRDISGTFGNVSLVITQSLSRKCTFCSRYGASVACKMSCTKFFHYPCVAASGGLQIMQSYSIFCKEHLGQVPLVCSEDINCIFCLGLGDVSNLMMCSVCGDHYHGTCIGVAQLPSVRAGWQCKNCRLCQICRVPDTSEGRSLACEQCDKQYHASCLRPVMTTIPKYGWKCRCCRVCSDCGSRSPGAGTSSRWHAHYTVCDSCYQQRNKGFSCPICRRAYRAAAHREMVKCSTCNKYVHSTCDSEADLATYHSKIEINPDYEYNCPPCKNVAQNDRMSAAMRRNSALEEDSMSASQESLYDDCDVEMVSEKINTDVGLGKGKPLAAAAKVAKKRLGTSNSKQGTMPKGQGKLNFQKRFKFSDFGVKRSSKTKMRGIFGVPGVGLQKPSSDSNHKQEDEPGTENRLVLCSAKDKFVLTQDICVMCGAIGTDQEGCLISCSQCGQCYHPYCVMVKVTKVILQKGWRCLDCTVCEGCGQRNDESRLILCDDCDISYHIYCMDPPLDYVPHGNWKCKWCCVCQKCGASDPGVNSTWMNSYSECGPCASQSICPSCNEGYAEGELIIQCTNCDRWLHCNCDQIRSEEDAEICAEEGYMCVLCRPRDVPPPHKLPKKIQQQSQEICKPTTLPSIKSIDDLDHNLHLGLDGNHMIDGVCLSEHGHKHIKSLQLEQCKKKRKNKVTLEASIANKEASILAAIESVVAGSSLDNSLEDVKLEPLDPKEEAEIYKDGMVWDRADASPPEGFTLCTTEQGVVVLRKRRQRNLQKLGIGGFSVRNRNVKGKEGTAKDEGDEIDFNSPQQQFQTNLISAESNFNSSVGLDKKRKPIRKKQKSKLIETYPSYLQEAFFGKILLDTNKLNVQFESSSSDDEMKSNVTEDKTIKLSMDELKIIEAMRAKQVEQNTEIQKQKEQLQTQKSITEIKEEISNLELKTEKFENLLDDNDDSDTDALKDLLPGDLIDNDLVDTIMNEKDEITKNTEDYIKMSDIEEENRIKSEFPDIFNCDPLVMDSKEVEEIFKVVLTDESQESQESIMTNTFPQSNMPQNSQPCLSMPVGNMQSNIQNVNTPQSQQTPHLQNTQILNSVSNQIIQQAGNQSHFMQPSVLDIHNHQTITPQQRVQHPAINQQMKMQQNFVDTSGYNKVHNTQFNNTIGQLPVRMDSVDSTHSTPSTPDESMNSINNPQPTSNQKSTERMRQDEALGELATISAVLYANTNHPELKNEYPNWPDRCKQILKKWRALSTERKAPFLQQARDNRSALRMKKAHQDQEKINAQQKSLREQEQERQWKQLQANRAREQQMQQLVLQDQRVQGDPTLPIQISTNQNNFSVGPLASPSPNSRNTQFVAPANKGRLVNPSQSPSQNGQFQHPGMLARPGTVQISRGGQIQQTLNQSPFSPQSQTPLSPLDQGYPGSPATQNNIDPFSRPSSENSQPDSFVQHSPRGYGQQSPNPTPNRSPAYVAQSPGNQVGNNQNQIRLNSENNTYNQPPGTPRPQYNTGNTRPTVYARPGELFTSQNSPFTSPRNDVFHVQSPQIVQQPTQQTQSQPQNPQQTMQTDGNRQLRDLLQRQQIATSNSPSCTNQQQILNQQTGQNQTIRWSGNEEEQNNNPITNTSDVNTFRQPLPPGMILRPQRMPGGTIIRTNQIVQSGIQTTVVANPRGIPLSDIRQRIVRPVSINMINGQQIITHQQQQQQQQQINPQSTQYLLSGGQRVPVGIANMNRNISNDQLNQVIQNSQSHIMQQTVSNDGSTNFINQRIEMNNMQTEQNVQNVVSSNVALDNAMRNTQVNENQNLLQGNVESESNEIPDNVTAELEKLEQEEGNAMGEVEGVGDILGGLDEDDEDLLVSLTAEMGADFNILEYADPELDTLNDGEKANLLDSLELEGDLDKEEKKKDIDEKSELPSMHDENKLNVQNSNMQMNSGQQITSSDQHGQQRSNLVDPSNQIITSQQQQVIINSRNQNVILSHNLSQLNMQQQSLQSQQQQQPQQQQQQQHTSHQQQQQSHQQQQIQSQQNHPPQLVLATNAQDANQIHRIKAIQQTQISAQQLPPHLQQVQQQMQQQVQQAAAMGKSMPIGTQLLSKDGAIGIVTANNGVAVSFPGLVNRAGNLHTIQNQQRLQQIRLTNATQLQQGAPQARMMLQQTHRLVGVLNQQQPQQNNVQQAPPPPPYPGPPPPYPGNAQQNQEQPLLLEDLLEQEKREQERQMVTSTTSPANEITNIQGNNMNLLNDQDFERLKVDVIDTPQALPAQGLLPVKQNQVINNTITAGGSRLQFVQRGVNQHQWRSIGTINVQNTQVINSTQENVTTAQSGFQIFNANLQPPPQLPPDNIITEQDRQLQASYEQWLNNQNTVLSNQLKFYETEVLRLRKIRKSLNSKQRQLKKTGNVLTEPDATELAKITHEQAFYQKHLDSARKQCRQHSLVIQDYNTKQKAKIQPPQGTPVNHTGQSPAQQQLASPSHAAIPPSPQQGLLHSTTQSPVGNHMLQPTQSPLHSPSPALSSQSPGPANVNSIMQSPGPQSNSGMSPYGTMQSSPRIGTPHSQHNDENPFSPNSIGPSVSPIPNRLTSPAPRITSPSNRMSAPQTMQTGRIQTQIMVQQQQTRFVRPQSINNDQNRPRMMSVQQQQLHIRGHSGYNSPLGSPSQQQGIQVQQLDQMQAQRMNLVQQRHLQQQRQLYQQQQQQHQQIQQHQQLQQHQQHQQHQQQHGQHQQIQQMQQQQQVQIVQQFTNQSPVHQQPPSPMPNQNPATSPMPRSPMIGYQPPSPLVTGSPLVMRPPSNSGTINSPAVPDRPQSVESSPRNSYLQHQLNDGSEDSMGGGGGNLNTIPIACDSFYSRMKPGLKGGSPMWGRGTNRTTNPPMSVLIKESQQQHAQNEEQNDVLKKDGHITKVSIIKRKPIPGKFTQISIKAGESSNIKKHDQQEQRVDDIVIIDSSPDEKQRIMDYDDDNDKALVATEVSLSSVAQHSSEVDDISVIESFTAPEFGDIVSSPLESSEVTDEYVLFASDVVADYGDSDDQNKDDKTLHLITLGNDDNDIISSHEQNITLSNNNQTDHTRECDSSKSNVRNSNNSNNINDDITCIEHKIINKTTHHSPSLDHHYAATESDIINMGQEIVLMDRMKSPDGHNIATTEDFEAMIDCGNSKDDKDITLTSSDKPEVNNTITTSSTIQLSNANPSSSIAISGGQQLHIQKSDTPKIIQIVTQTSGNNKTVSNPIMTYSHRIPLTAAIRPCNTSAVGIATNKKFVKDATQTTAKVSIGNTTISVPVLKTVSVHGNHPQNSNFHSKNPLEKINITKAPTVINVGAQKINSSSIFTLTSINLSQTTARLVQTLSKQTTASSVQYQTTVKPITTSTLSAATAESIIEKLSPKSSSPSGLTYSKLSSLTVTQDASLPNKIFDDESISPDSSIEHDDHDLISPEKIDISLEKELLDTKESKTSEETTSSQSQQQTAPVQETNSNQSNDTKPGTKPGVIPVHVIIKSRESSQSPVTQSNTQQRVVPIMPQLSPLSQPTEITTNMANVSQQLRSIMSSINSNTTTSTSVTKSAVSTSSTTTLSAVSVQQQPNQVQTSNHSQTQQSSNDQVNYETLLPSTKVENLHKGDEKPKEAVLETQQIQRIPTEATTTNFVQSKILSAQLLSADSRLAAGMPAGSGNILVVKQLRTPVSSNSTTPNQTPTQTVFLTTQNHLLPNLAKIQAGDLKSQQNIIFTSTPLISTSQPPALIVTTSRPGVISNANISNIISSSAATLMGSPAQAVKSNISGSILSATLSQPSTKTNTLLHTQLTNSPFRRSKSTDEVPATVKETPAQILGNKRHSLEASVATANKTEQQDANKDDNIVTSTSNIAHHLHPPLSSVTKADSQSSGCKYSSIAPGTPIKSEDSQNVLLKQLLQNSGATSTSSPTSPAISNRPVSGLRAPSLGVVSSLEAQLARPVIPPVPATGPTTSHAAILTTVSSTPIQTMHSVVVTSIGSKTGQSELSTATPHRILSKETSFVSKPIMTTSTQSNDNSSNNLESKTLANALNSIKSENEKIGKPTTMPTKCIKITTTSANTFSSAIAAQNNTQITPPPPPPYPATTGQSSNIPTPTTPTSNVQSSTPSNIESAHQLMQSPDILSNTSDIKKELLDENSQQSILSDQGINKHDTSMIKEEFSNDAMETDHHGKSAVESAIEIKRKKRREYQKNRRQMQIMNKELAKESSSVKKKPRKVSKIDEDYDTFIDNLMSQMRQLPQMEILEPLLSKNYNVCPIYGYGDYYKSESSKKENRSVFELTGPFGQAQIPNISDFYNTKPFGFNTPLEEQAPVSNHRGFYDQEFPPVKFDVDDERLRYDYLLKERDIGTPDTIISTSSPECVNWDTPVNFPGLRLIKEDSMDDEMFINKRMSPQIPIVVPVPVRLKKGISLTADKSLDSKENDKHLVEKIGTDSKFSPPVPVKDNNITVTLTLTSSAAEDIIGVLKDLANILNIPPPSTYQIVERTTTPPSQKLGLYRTKGKDGKEGVPIDIQTILNGEAKFCRHCDVVILSSMIRAKSSEFPLLALNTSNNDFNETEDLYFCSKNCYKQFQWRPTSILDDKTITEGNQNKVNNSLSSSAFIDLENLDSSNSKSNEISTIKQELDEINDGKKVRKIETSQLDEPPKKILKGMRYKYYTNDCFSSPVHKYKKPTDKEITEMLFRMNITVSLSPKMPDDTRKCIFCHSVGDGVADGPSRLLNFDVDKWVHLNCALWSDGVYETENGALMQCENALQASLGQTCIFCNNLGATLKCFKPRCGSIYHLNCAMKDNVVFYKNKSIMCSNHAPKSEKDNELTTLSVERRVYIDRDESRQVASVMHYSELSNLMRVGSLIFLNVGQLLPHQLASFHNQNYIYPIGYKIIRFYWSMRRPNKRCRYVCSIADVSGRPEFRVLVQEPNEEDIELRDSSARAVWQRILEPMAQLRKDTHLVQVFPKYVSGEDLFGLAEPSIVRILESLPGVETLNDYKFKYGRNPLLELPLAINPSGAARTEAKLKAAVGWKKPHTQRSGSSSQRPAFVPSTSVVGEVACPYSKQFVHSKSSQYKKMKQEWRNNVFLARSKIQGLGLYAARDLEKHTMVIEYIGEVIRTELSELREKQYEARNRGIYMFRLDEDRVVDATLSGGLARYINHSCNPNCVTEIVEVDREYRIIIFAKRRINRGEELSYDYKFDIEDDAHKISCMCGAPNCRKWMN